MTKKLNSGSRKKGPKQSDKQKVQLQKIEKNLPEISFFQRPENPVSNIQRRLYGVLEYNTIIESIRNSKMHPDRKNEYISDIIHNTQNLANILAYCSHNGKNWRKDGIQKMQDGLLKQFQSGRAMEVLLTEAMINTKTKISDGVDFLPVKELDNNYKTDMISRLPYQNGHKTFSFGTQITLADAKTQQKYIDKYEQVKAFIPVLENTITRNEIEEKYGRIYQIDMMSYVAINGSIREYMMNNMPALHNFRKWRKNGFDTSGILPYFPQDFQNKIKIIAENILQTQQYILSQEFLESIGNSWEQQEIIQDTYTKKLSYDINKQEIKLEISNGNETIVTATFWFTQKTFEKIFDNIYPEYQPEYNFDKKK